MNGPEPVVSAICWLIGSSATRLGMTNSGTEAVLASVFNTRPNGSLSTMLKVRSSIAFIDCVTRASRPPCTSLSVKRLIEGRTSAEVTGDPSCHLSPSRSLKVQVSLSSLTVQLSTICGCGSSLASSANSWS